MTDKQPEALRLARELEGVHPVNIQDQEAAAAELRRLLAANIDCVAWYEAVKAHRDELLKALNYYRLEAHDMVIQRDELQLVLRIVLGKHACGALVLPQADRERIEAAIAKGTAQ